MKTTKIFIAMLTLLLLSMLTLAAKAQTPGFTIHGAWSVQQFMGGTQNTWLAVYPPTTYADGGPIPGGTPVQLKVYRSFDGGVTYSSPVRIESGGRGYVGQGAAGTRQKPWIDMKVITGVDNKSPYEVYLAVGAVIDGVEGMANVDNLTFSYYPSMVRYALPSDAPGSSPSAIGGNGDGGNGNGRGGNGNRNGTGPLTGSWKFDDAGVLTFKEDSSGLITGHVTFNGIGVAAFRGTRRGNTYRLTARIQFEEFDERGEFEFSVSSDGKSFEGTSSVAGEEDRFSGSLRGGRITLNG